MRTITEQQLLADFADSHELVLRGSADGGDLLLTAWRTAADDARAAYDAWCLWPSALSHAAYVALSDQADCAMATLAADRAAVGATAGPHAPQRLAA